MSKSVLVIDDDPVLRESLRRMLETLDYVVTEADNGARGLQQFRKSPPDLVITDMLMPEKEGFETIQEIRREDPGAKIIAISGGGVTGNLLLLELAEKIGVSATLRKPIRFEELARAVRSV